MNRTKWLSLLLMLVATSAMAGTDTRKEARLGNDTRRARSLSSLGLSPEQKMEIRQIRQDFRKERQVLLESQRETTLQYREARQSSDSARLKAMQPALEAQREQLSVLHEQESQKVRSILTPEQQVRWDAMTSKRDTCSPRGASAQR